MSRATGPGLSFVIGAAIPLAPLVLVGGRPALPLSWALSVAVLLGVGVLKGVLTGRPLLRSGLAFASVALGSAVVGWLVGTLFDRAFGVTLP
jgi:VIT1/CCC1 family predicted Fe2+/Mn2+ transporter